MPRRLPHRDVGRAEIILHPRMGGHCVVPRNGPAYLGTIVVEDGPAGLRVLDDELDQLHRRICQASGGFHEEDGKVVRVRGEIPEDGPIPSYLACGPDLLDPPPGDASSWEDRVAVGIEHRLGEVGRSGRVADGHVDVPTVGGGDEATVGSGQSGVPGKGPTGAKVGDGLPGADLEGSVVVAGFVAEVGGAGRCCRPEGVRGAPCLGRTERMEVWVEETALSRSMVVSRTAWWRWILKNWLPEQTRQWKGDSSASMVGTQEGSRCADGGGRGGE